MAVQVARRWLLSSPAAVLGGSLAPERRLAVSFGVRLLNSRRTVRERSAANMAARRQLSLAWLHDEHSRAKTVNVLVVDDEPSMSMALSYLLESQGHRVEVAANGREALDLMAEQPFELAVIDWMLPGIRGHVLCIKLREQADIPVVMISARSDARAREACLAAGADVFLAKPFGRAQLAEAISVAIAAHGSRIPAPRAPVAGERYGEDQAPNSPGTRLGT